MILSTYYRPGFSTYPSDTTFAEIYNVLSRHPATPWISAEGTNVVPNGLPGEVNMETYLGRMFNHGAVLVNVFSWGIGGIPRFLHGGQLVESHSQSSIAVLQSKLHQLQRELPGWVQTSGQQARVAPSAARNPVAVHP